jgi:catalase
MNTPNTPEGTGWADQADDANTIAMLVERVRAQQQAIASSAHTGLGGRVDRAQHQKQLLGAFGILRLAETIPAAANAGPFMKRDGAGRPVEYRVACRFSNGQPCPRADTSADVRGVALKFFTGEGIETDLLMTNEGGRSHARNAPQFMAVADILVAKLAEGATEGISKASEEVRSGELGAADVARAFAILFKETTVHKAASLATERYWGSVVQLGDAAIKYSLHPHESSVAGTIGDRHGDDYLRDDIVSRLEKGSVKWRLCLQLFVDEEHTPVRDASVAWDAALVPVGELEIPTSPSGGDEATINQMAFNPGNGFGPLGITHARKDVYAASAANRKDRGLLSSDEAREVLRNRPIARGDGAA